MTGAHDPLIMNVIHNPSLRGNGLRRLGNTAGWSRVIQRRPGGISPQQFSAR
jgi:hypothetical protein